MRNSRRVLVVLAAWLAAQVGQVAADPQHVLPAEAKERLLSSYAAFRAAREQVDEQALAIWSHHYGLQGDRRRELLTTYVAFLREVPRFGALAARVSQVESFSNGARTVAFLRLSAAHGSGRAPMGESTAIAFSDDGGTSWTINVVDCISSEKITELVPGYTGVPPIQ